MPDIVLTTLNAKYIHAAFGLRCLLANLGPLRSRARIVEFDLSPKPVDIAEVLLAHNPKIIGLGVYLWNVAPATEVVATLKRVRPDVIIILGGPEVSYESDAQRIVQLADHVITGEADLKFAEVCGELLGHGAGARPPQPLPKMLPAELPDLDQLALPYDLYSADDIAHRVIYVEASRGCPFTCEFCLSSLDIPVRQFPLPAFLAALQQLLDRGVQRFKFVDRTFNLDISASCAILKFLLERHQPGCFYHFEMVPDRLPAGLREIIARFPAGALQLEVGIQTFNADVAARIRRRQDYPRLEENLRYLRGETAVYLHADLIAGLPGENLESFAAGFDRLIPLRPQEIQVGILKRLRGTPIARHDAEWQMVYNSQPPYELLQNGLIDFATMQQLRRFARYWDLVGNSGNFVETTPLLWSGVGVSPAAAAPGAAGPAASRPPEARSPARSPFHAFWRWSEWAHGRIRRTDSIALGQLMELLFEFLTLELKRDPQIVAETLWRDYQRGGRNDKPVFLRPLLTAESHANLRRQAAPLKRQARHLPA